MFCLRRSSLWDGRLWGSSRSCSCKWSTGRGVHTGAQLSSSCHTTWSVPRGAPMTCTLRAPPYTLNPKASPKALKPRHKRTLPALVIIAGPGDAAPLPEMFA